MSRGQRCCQAAAWAQGLQGNPSQQAAGRGGRRGEGGGAGVDLLRRAGCAWLAAPCARPGLAPVLRVVLAPGWWSTDEGAQVPRQALRVWEVGAAPRCGAAGRLTRKLFGAIWPIRPHLGTRRAPPAPSAQATSSTLKAACWGRRASAASRRTAGQSHEMVHAPPAGHPRLARATHQVCAYVQQPHRRCNAGDRGLQPRSGAGRARAGLVGRCQQCHAA